MEVIFTTKVGIITKGSAIMEAIRSTEKNIAIRVNVPTKQVLSQNNTL